MFRLIQNGIFAVIPGLALLTLPCIAGDITYKPINPSFGGNSFNSAHLLGLANAQNIPKRKDEARKKADAEAARQAAREAREQSNSDRFVRLLESRLYSGLAGQVSDAIFGENAQQQGQVRFQDQEVTWVNNGTEIKLTVNDFGTGETTEVIIPTASQ